MRAVGVLPMKREVRIVEHVAPQLSSDYQVKIRSLEVGICGTDKEICAFEYGTPPAGCEQLGGFGQKRGVIGRVEEHDVEGRGLARQARWRQPGQRI